MIKSDFIVSYLKLDDLSKNEKRLVSLSGLAAIFGSLLFWGGHLSALYIITPAMVYLVWIAFRTAIKAKK